MYSVKMGLKNTTCKSANTHTQTNMNSGVFIEARKSFKVGFKNGPLKASRAFSPISLRPV